MKSSIAEKFLVILTIAGIMAVCYVVLFFLGINLTEANAATRTSSLEGAYSVAMQQNASVTDFRDIKINEKKVIFKEDKNSDRDDQIFKVSGIDNNSSDVINEFCRTYGDTYDSVNINNCEQAWKISVYSNNTDNDKITDLYVFSNAADNSTVSNSSKFWDKFIVIVTDDGNAYGTWGRQSAINN